MPHPTDSVAVRHPVTGQYVALDRAIDYDAEDMLVAAYPWAFAVREAPEGQVVEDGVVTGVAVPKIKTDIDAKKVARNIRRR